MNTITDKRLTVLVGNYGSGKTEIALQMAFDKAAQGKSVTLVDLDIVNPYFRSAEQKEALEAQGIQVLMPTFAMTGVDVPSLPAQIQSVFGGQGDVIFDVGGDDTGAAALGRYHPYFEAEREDTEVCFVVNINRPLSGEADAIVDLMERVANRSKLTIDCLINNTNLAGDTTAEMLCEGQEILEKAARRTNVPIRALCGEWPILEKLPQSLKGLGYPIVRRMKPEWME